MEAWENHFTALGSELAEKVSPGEMLDKLSQEGYPVRPVTLGMAAAGYEICSRVLGAAVVRLNAADHGWFCNKAGTGAYGCYTLLAFSGLFESESQALEFMQKHFAGKVGALRSRADFAALSAASPECGAMESAQRAGRPKL